MPLPVYVFNGFLESGKTSLIKTTLLDEEFNNGSRTLILQFEEGIEEFEDDFLEKVRAKVVSFDSLEEISVPVLRALDEEFWPDQVMIEYNGTWDIDRLIQKELPSDWMIVQIISLIDATTFSSYINNMRTFMFNIIKQAEVVIFNRLDESISKSYLRTNVKSINKAAQIVYEMKDGTISNSMDEDLPFDLDKDPIVIEEDDYGLWYLDALENVKKYQNKHVQFKGRVTRRPQDKDSVYIIGRRAMTCCAEDIQLFGYLVRGFSNSGIQDGDWIELTALVDSVYDPAYETFVPVLEEVKHVKIDPLEDELVYFS